MAVTEIKNISYGPHERNRLDAYLVGKEGRPSPVLIFFHGGGYVNGDTTAIQTMNLLEECLQAGISVISATYRFITDHPFPAPMEDGTRAIQFVRYISEEWHLDAERVASAGRSAGGHIALWNALKGNLANVESDDPVERMSSEVLAFIGYATQVSKDQRFYEGIYEGPHIQPNLTLFYGIDSLNDLYRPDILQLAERASAINYVSKDSPPVFMSYDDTFDLPRIPEEATVNEVIHHPIHGYTLKQKYDELGIPFIFRHKGNPVQPQEEVQFLLDIFRA